MQTADNRFLAHIAAADRQDRESGFAQCYPDKVERHDAARRQLVLNEHDDGLLVTAADFEIAARIYHRGTTPLDIEHARYFEQRARELRAATRQ